MRESIWYGIDICSECNERLSSNEVMHSNGICPKCGHDGAGTVCDHKKVVLKQFKHHPWWRFWDRKHTYKGKDKFSQEWLSMIGWD